jgi:hypothetical protein
MAPTRRVASVASKASPVVKRTLAGKPASSPSKRKASQSKKTVEEDE